MSDSMRISQRLLHAVRVDSERRCVDAPLVFHDGSAAMLEDVVSRYNDKLKLELAPADSLCSAVSDSLGRSGSHCIRFLSCFGLLAQKTG